MTQSNNASDIAAITALIKSSEKTAHERKHEMLDYVHHLLYAPPELLPPELRPDRMRRQAIKDQQNELLNLLVGGLIKGTKDQSAELMDSINPAILPMVLRRARELNA